MTMKRFVDREVFRDGYFSLGVEAASGCLYLSTPIPSRHRLADYEAYFRIERAEYERFRADPQAAADFVERCCDGRNGDRLIAP